MVPFLKAQFCLLPLFFITAPVLQGEDWPNWLGPLKNGSSPETKLLTTWPSNGPKVLWTAQGGEGYSSIAVSQGRAITLVQKEGKEIVLALDAVKGTELWSTPLNPGYKNQYGNGPRSTPTIEGDFAYVQSVTGPLACLEVKTGNVVWKKDLLKDFKGKNISWGLSASPVIEGNLVLAIPGATDAGVVAFDKKTGNIVWKVGSDKAGYASPVPITIGGKRQLVFFNAAGLLSVSPEGNELWRVRWITEYDCNICTPILIGEDKLFVTSGEQNGCKLFQLQAEGEPKVIWQGSGKKSPMTNYWANSVVHEGYLYGVSGEFSEKIHFNCVDLKTGAVKWSKKEFGKGAITLADGHLFVSTKAGDLVLIQANPDKYQEKGRVSLLGDNRTVPTLANRRLYLRDKVKIVCLDVGAGN